MLSLCLLVSCSCTMSVFMYVLLVLFAPYRSSLTCFFFLCYGDHRDLHVLTHSFPPRRSSDLQGCNGHNASSRQRASNASDGPRQLFGALGRRKLVTFPACSLFKIGFQLVLWNTNCHRNTSAIRVDRAAQRGA